MADDEEAARAFLAQGERPPQPPRMAEWGPQVAELCNIVDRLTETNQILAALAGGKPSPVKPRPRPLTAIARLQERIADERHARMVARMLPDGPRPAKGDDPT